jgi:hypothetical protein
MLLPDGVHKASSGAAMLGGMELGVADFELIACSAGPLRVRKFHSQAKKNG